jgi:hypothetical protein
VWRTDDHVGKAIVIHICRAANRFPAQFASLRSIDAEIVPTIESGEKNAFVLA